MKEVKAKVNSTVVLECETWAVPEPTIRWYKDKQVRSQLRAGRSCWVWGLSQVHGVGFCLTPGGVILLPPFSFFPAASGKLQTRPDPQ